MTYPALLVLVATLAVISACGFLYEWREKRQQQNRVRDYLARPLPSNHPQRSNHKRAVVRAQQALKKRGVR